MTTPNELVAPLRGRAFGPNLDVSSISQGVIDPFVRRWPIFFAVLFSTVLVVLFFTIRLTPIYSAEAAIKLDPNQQHTSLDMAAMNGAPPDSALVDTEVSIMRSQAVAIEVVKTLNLSHDPEFNPGAKPTRSSLTNASPKTDLDSSASIEYTAGVLSKKISISREGATYLVHIDARSVDPNKAAEIANATAKAYLEISQAQKVASSKEQQNLLGARAAELQAQAEQANADLARYRAQAGIVDAGGSSGTSTDQQASALAIQLSGAKSEAATADAKAESARRQVASGQLDAVPEVLGSPVISDLRRQRTEILRQQEQVNSHYGPKHPEAIRIAGQLAQIDAQLQAEADRIVESLGAAARAADERADSLSRQLAALNGRQAVNDTAKVQADALQHRYEALTSQANATTQNAQRAAEEAQIGLIPGRLAALAIAPTTPSFPNKPLFVLLGAVLGAVLGATAVVALELWDSTVRSPDDIEHLFGVPYIASVPLLKTWGALSKSKPHARKNRRLPPWDYVMAKPMSSFTESLRNIRTALKLGAGGPKVIAITSALPNEGKTLTAVSLSRVMAQSGDRVLLIDGDLRRNSLNGLTPDSKDSGLLQVLQGRVTLDAAIVKDKVPGLDILPLSEAVHIERDVFGSPRMAELMKHLRSRYDHIVIDTPPVLAVSDALQIGALSDAILLVIRWGKTPGLAISSTIERMQGANLSVRGAVLSMVNMQRRAFIGRRDSGYYIKSYNEYYSE